MSTIHIQWKWGTNTEVNFNLNADVLDFGWFQAGQFKVSEVNNAVIISIPSNQQTYTIKGVSLKQLTASNVTCKDDSATKFWSDLIRPANHNQHNHHQNHHHGFVQPENFNSWNFNHQNHNQKINPAGKYFSPYIDLGLWASRNFPSMCLQAGIKGITLAFLVGQGNSLRWGGNGGQINQFAKQIREAQQNGVEVTVSFGGAQGIDPAVSYDSAQALADDLQKVIDLGVSRLDFDIEASNVGNVESNKKRGKALSLVKKRNPNVQITFTLAVLPSGLTAEGLDIVRQAKESGFNVDGVHVMAMDYCQGVKNMGQAAIDAAKNTYKQIRSLGLDKSHIGLIPMIGCNDSFIQHGQVFTLGDAEKVLEFCKHSDFIKCLSMWSLTRDNGGQPYNQASYASSGLKIDLWGFSNIFKRI